MTFDETSYTDLVSGGRRRRGGKDHGGKAWTEFERMLQVAERQFDVLVVRDQSRFSRDEYDGPADEKRLHEAGVVVAYVVEGSSAPAASRPGSRRP